MGDVRVDTSGFEKFIKKIEGIDTHGLMVGVTAELSNRVLRDAKENTPVGEYEDGRQGGTLRRNWFVTNVRKVGNTYETEVKNDTDYAGYVESGHRTRVRKDGSRSWIPGQFILLKATNKINRKAPDIIKARLIEHMK